MNEADSAVDIWTVGHSSRAIEEFLALLQPDSIQLIADVRRFAGSRKYPHFNPEPLAASLRQAGIDYVAMPELGGRRKSRPNSPHTVWRHPAFRGYADHMDTPEFRNALERFIDIAKQKRSALMCAEAVWWRCHRALIADALKVRGVRVLHIMSAQKATEHPYTSAAQIVNGQLHYGSGAEGSGIENT